MESWEPSWPGRPVPAGSLGSRIAGLRAGRGWTQQQLADRLGISRVAVSHLETDINVPGERTVALLAGCFRLEPHELVEGTTYPVAKADRLPVVAARWTNVELRLALLERDLWWVDEHGAALGERVVTAVLDDWTKELRELQSSVEDRSERRAVKGALEAVAKCRREGFRPSPGG
ncbi:MAG: helix-turn-helix transcriptional regulator [Acidimicrobiales bacterium]|nr:helix-turn-helix transcriptional regulator [Acidimicrobiales bacterium]